MKELAATHPNVHIVTADITKPDLLESAVAEIDRATGGGLDILIQNAAWVGDDTSTPWDGFTANAPSNTGKFRTNLVEAVDTNVVGMMNVVRIFRPLISKGRLKKMIVISTALADTGFTKAAQLTYHIPYAASKAAMNLVIAKMAIDFEKEGILLCALCPGWVKVDPKPSPSSPHRPKILFCANRKLLLSNRKCTRPSSIRENARSFSRYSARSREAANSDRKRTGNSESNLFRHDGTIRSFGTSYRN